MATVFNRLMDKLLLIIPIGVIGNLLFVYFWTEDKEFGLSNFSIPYLLLAMGLAFFPWIAHALRVLLWARFLEHRFNFIDSLRIVVNAELAAALSPTVIGGSPMKWGMLVKKGVKPGAAATLTTINLFEEVILFTIVIPVVLTLTQAWDLPQLQLLLSEFFKFFSFNGSSETVGALLIFLPSFFLFTQISAKSRPTGRLGRFFAKVADKFRSFSAEMRQAAIFIWRYGKSLFALSMLITASQWICRCSVATALIWGLGIAVNPIEMFILQWIVFLTMVIVPTPGAIGGAEFSFYLIFESVIPAGAIGLVLGAWRFLSYYCQLAVGALLSYLLRDNPPQ